VAACGGLIHTKIFITSHLGVFFFIFYVGYGGLFEKEFLGFYKEMPVISYRGA
jgi:hypothetical protein